MSGSFGKALLPSRRRDRGANRPARRRRGFIAQRTFGRAEQIGLWLADVVTAADAAFDHRALAENIEVAFEPAGVGLGPAERLVGFGACRRDRADGSARRPPREIERRRGRLPGAIGLRIFRAVLF